MGLGLANLVRPARDDARVSALGFQPVDSRPSSSQVDWALLPPLVVRLGFFLLQGLLTRLLVLTLRLGFRLLYLL